jgi:hypothetical protein
MDPHRAKVLSYASYVRSNMLQLLYRVTIVEFSSKKITNGMATFMTTFAKFGGKRGTTDENGRLVFLFFFLVWKLETVTFLMSILFDVYPF